MRHVLSITTDAMIESKDLVDLLRRAAGVSFNQMCIDNDMSTSDSVICLANGASGVPMLEPGTEDFIFVRGSVDRPVPSRWPRRSSANGEGATNSSKSL